MFYKISVVSQVDKTGGTVTENGRFFDAFVVAKGQSIRINLSDYDIRMPPSLRLVVAGQMVSGTASDLSATLSWYEDV